MLFNKTISEFDYVLYDFESMSNIIVVINRSNEPSHIKMTFCDALFHF